jgi:photosystem II stability/assembly factor-like uncharacterized protein
MKLLYLFLTLFINIGPEGGMVSQIEISPVTGDVYAGFTVGGFYVTHDNGNTWEPIIKYPDSLYFKEFSFLKPHYFKPDSVMYLIAKGDNDKYSRYFTLNQVDWYPVQGALIDSSQEPVGIAVVGPYILWGFKNIIYKSDFWGGDSGVFFTPETLYNELTNFGDTILISGVDGAFFSYNLGGTWDTLYVGQNVTTSMFLPPNPDTVSAVLSVPLSGVYYLVNNAWRTSNLTGVFVGKFHIYNDVLFAIEGVRIWRSFDHGKTFEPVPIPDTLNFMVNDAVSIADTLMLGTTGGILISYDNGDNYYFRNGNLKKFVIFNIDVHPFIKRNVLVSVFGTGPVRINNLGSDYKINNRGMVLPYVWQSVYHPHAPETLYTVNAFENRMYRFSNGMWDTLPLDPPRPILFMYVHPDSSLKHFYYAGTKDGIYISKDYGSTWVQRLANRAIWDIEFLPIQGDTVPIIVGTSSNGFFISRDTGFTFTQIPYFPTDSNFVSFDMNPFDRNEIYILNAFGKLYRTMDGGTSWDTLSIPHSPELFNFSSVKILPSYKGIFYVSQVGVDGLYQFFERGDTFFYFLRDIYPPAVVSLEFSRIQPSGGILYAGTFEGTWFMADTNININFNIFDDTIFTPEGDGIDDSLRFEIHIFDSSNIGRTDLYVTDTLGNTYVRASYPPSEFNFDKLIWYFGYDSTGKQMPPGRYLCRVNSFDGFANEKTIEIPFHIDYIPLQTRNQDAFMNFNQRKVAKNGNTVHIVYTSWGNNPEIYYTMKQDTTWHYPLNVSNTFHAKSYMPALSAGNKTAIVYIEAGSNSPLRIAIYRNDTLLNLIPVTRQRECADPVILEDDFDDFHIVWSEKPAGIFNRIVYMKIRNDGSVAISPTEIANISSADIHSLYLCEDSLANLYLFFKNSVGNKIYYKKGDLNGNWQPEVLVFDGEFPQAISDNLSRIYLLRVFDSNLYFNYMEADTWSSDYRINESQSVKRYTSSMDSLGNLYVLFESPDSSIYLRVRDNLGNWADIQYMGKGSYPQMPEKFNGYFYVLELDSLPFTIRERSLTSYGDTIPPSFTFNFNPSEPAIGEVDTIKIYSSEILRSIPEFYIVRSDSFVFLNIYEDTTTSSPLDYISYFDSRGYEPGNVVFEIRGVDVAGNLGIERDTLVLRKSGEFVPEWKFAIYPNPARNTDEVHISYYINENSDIKVKIYTITGRHLKTINGNAIGGMRNEIIWKFTDNVHSGLYLVVFEARGKNTGDFKRIIKRLGVIR